MKFVSLFKKEIYAEIKEFYLKVIKRLLLIDMTQILEEKLVLEEFKKWSGWV